MHQSGTRTLAETWYRHKERGKAYRFAAKVRLPDWFLYNMVQAISSGTKCDV